MGGQLVIEVVRATTLDRLPARARMVLMLMAAHAMDRAKGDTPARVYWGGQRLLAIEIYGPHEWDAKAWTRKEIRQTIRELEKRGLVAVYADEIGGVTAYELLPRGGGSNTPGGPGV